MDCFQVSLFDLILLVSLLGITAGGVAEFVEKQPTERPRVNASVWSSGLSQSDPMPEVMQIDRLPLLIDANVLAAATVLAVLVGLQLPFSRGSRLKKSIPRIAATIACLAIVAGLAAVGDRYDYFSQQLLAADWPYVFGGEWFELAPALETRALWVAIAAAWLVTGKELLTPQEDSQRIAAAATQR
jgi:hypothetical protein